MAELSSEKPPFHNRNHDLSLALDICNGFRPEFGRGTPEVYKKLAYKCMNADPNQRPRIDELNQILLFWCHSIYGEIFSYKGKKIEAMFKEADKKYFQFHMKKVLIPCVLAKYLHLSIYQNQAVKSLKDSHNSE
jgi:hypothetical protein